MGNHPREKFLQENGYSPRSESSIALEEEVIHIVALECKPAKSIFFFIIYDILIPFKRKRDAASFK